MLTANLIMRPRPALALPALKLGLILIWVVCLCVGSAGCAFLPKTPPRVSSTAPTTPHTELPEELRTGAFCDGLRGVLPDGDELTVAALGHEAVNEAAYGQCQKDRADRLVAIHDASNAAWEAYAHGAH